MASEPKKPMEQMLEALAKARRAQFGDDANMPNPMRARLHEEIARAGRAENEEIESRPSWITMFWPRVTVAAALATLLVLVPAIWWNQSHQIAEPGGFAVRDRAAAASDALNLAAPAKDSVANAPAVSTTEPTTVNLADNDQVKAETAIAPSSESEASKSSSGFAQSRGESELSIESKKGFDKEIASAKVQAAPAAAPLADADSKAQSNTRSAAAPPVSQSSSAAVVAPTHQFSQQSAVQSFRNNLQASRGAKVLNTFQVQQEGNEIRVLDADGSTYSGAMGQSANGADVESRITARRELLKQKSKYVAKAASQNKSTIPQSYFRATGYNVTLKRNVVFEGNYETPPQQPATGASNEKKRTQQGAERARIVGTVRVNGEAPLEVDAIAENPEAAATKKSDK
jgi:hypothetical protein